MIRKARHGVVNQIDQGLDTIDELTVTRVSAAKIGDGDTDSTKLEGFFTTYANASSTMYVPVAASSGYERLFKIAADITSNDGGYFEPLYVNVRVPAASTASGVVRAIEAKATINGNMGNSAEAAGLYAKVSVSGSVAEVSHGMGIDVLLEEGTTGALTKGTGIRIQGGEALNSEVIDVGLDVSGNYKQGAIKTKFGTAAFTPGATYLVAAFGTAANKAPSATSAFIGHYYDSNASKLHIISAYNGAYYACAGMTVVS